jgi:hypothetical protein
VERNDYGEWGWGGAGAEGTRRRRSKLVAERTASAATLPPAASSPSAFLAAFGAGRSGVEGAELESATRRRAGGVPGGWGRRERAESDADARRRRLATMAWLRVSFLWRFREETRLDLRRRRWRRVAGWAAMVRR